MKKSIILFIVVLGIVLTGICIFFYNQTVAPEKPVQSYETISPKYQSRGYTNLYCTSLANYYFTDEMDNFAEEYIGKAEIILQTAIHKYHIQPMMPGVVNICFRGDSVFYEGNSKTDYLEINPDDKMQEGILTYFVSGGKLPIWLCRGLERYWINQYHGVQSEFNLKSWICDAQKNNLPALGDEWVIPNLIKSELSKDVTSAAEKLVECLDDKNKLYSLIECYLKDNFREAEKIYYSEMEYISNTNLKDTNFYFHYYMNQYQEDIHQDILFSVQSEEAIYYFSDNDFWNLANVHDYLKTGESSITYAEEWFGKENSEVLKVYYIITDNINLIGQYSHPDKKEIYYYNMKNYPPIGVVHEAVHVMLELFGYHTQGLYEEGRGRGQELFEEDLCGAIEILYTMETSDETAIRNNYIQNLQILRDYCGDDATLEYLLTVISQGGDANKTNAYICSDLIAIQTIKKEDLEKKVNESEDRKLYLLNPDVGSAFLVHLLEKGERIDLLEIYENVNCAKEIYGQTLDELIDEWIIHLKMYAYKGK
ncbi:hypothetical protein [Faecalimonas sp.]